MMRQSKKIHILTSCQGQAHLLELSIQTTLKVLCIRFQSPTTAITNMDYKKHEYDLQRIKKSLRRGAIERNVKTGLIVAAAASGALISTPALLVTAGVTMCALYIANNRKTEDDVDSNPSSLKKAKEISTEEEQDKDI